MISRRLTLLGALALAGVSTLTAPAFAEPVTLKI